MLIVLSSLLCVNGARICKLRIIFPIKIKTVLLNLFFSYFYVSFSTVRYDKQY